LSRTSTTDVLKSPVTALDPFILSKISTIFRTMRYSAFISIFAVLSATTFASPALRSAHYTKEWSPTTKLAARHSYFGSSKVIPTSHPKRQIHNADYGSSPSTIPAAEATSTVTAPKSVATNRPGIRGYGRDVVEGLENSGTAHEEESEMESTEHQIEAASVKGLFGNNTMAPSGANLKRVFSK
jgi:hypothetical protein